MLSSDYQRREAISKFLMEFEDTTMTVRQAEAIAKYFVERNADPLVKELQKSVAQGRLEFNSQISLLKNKNSEIMTLSNKLRAALNQIAMLKGRAK